MFLAQVGAYKALRDESAETLSAARQVQPIMPVVAENPDHARLSGELREAASQRDEWERRYNNERLARDAAHEKITVLEETVHRLESQVGDKERRGHRSRDLGRLLADGQAELQALSNYSTDANLDRVDAWIRELEAYLDKIGPGYVARSRNGSGLVLGPTRIDDLTDPKARARRDAIVQMRIRLARIEQFIQEIAQ